MTNKKSWQVLLAMLLIVVMLMGLVGCSNPFDVDVKVTLVNSGIVEGECVVSIFKNGIAADISTDYKIGTTEVEEDGVMVTKDIEFLGWSPDEGATDGLYKAGGIVKYNDLVDYIVDGQVTLYAIYGVKIIEKHDLIIAWYNKSISGLTESIMETYEEALRDWLKQDSKFDGVDIVIRSYSGDVGTSCNAILDDGGADILIGWGGNVTSTGGIETLERFSGVTMGVASNRYIDIIRETTYMYDDTTTLSRAVWQWTTENTDLFA